MSSRISVSTDASIASTVLDKVFTSFNEILGEIGAFQIWSSFLILVSGISVSWETLALVFLAKEYPIFCIDPPGIDKCAQECERIYINSTKKSDSIILEWHLFCDNNYKKQLSQSILIAGVMFGCLFYGHLADQLGRRPTFLSACMVVLICGIVVGLSNWFWFFCFTRFILGIGCGGMSIICIVFLVEYVDYSNREMMVIMYRIPFTVGHGTLPALAYFLNSWRILQISISAFAIIYVSYFWLLPESPRWLFITGQLERCIGVLRTGAKHNGRPTEKIRHIIETAYDDLRSHNFSRNGTMVDLFRSRNLCKKTTILIFLWFTLFLEFYGVLEYITYMKGNMYINFGIGAWMSLPSTMIAYPISACMPRRDSLFMTFGLSAVCMLIVPILSHLESHNWFIIFSIMNIALLSAAFCIMHLFSTELFPTILRNSGMGLSMCSGFFGCLLAPFLSHIAVVESYWVPPLIFGTFSLIATVLLLFLPETKGAILTDTIEESEEFGKK